MGTLKKPTIQIKLYQSLLNQKCNGLVVLMKNLINLIRRNYKIKIMNSFMENFNVITK